MRINTKNNILSIIILSIITIITRIPFVSKYLFEWDSVQFALGMENFNIIHHQPHPPGYFFYIYSAKLLNFLIKNPNYSLIAVNIILCVVAAIIFFIICNKIFQNKLISFFASIIFITNPFVWFHSEFANVYMIDCLFSLIYFYLSYLIFIEKKNYTYLFSFLFAIGIGFRQSLIIFFSPLYIFSIIYFLLYHKRSIKKILINIIIFVVTNLFWILPTIYLSGGFAEFWNVTKFQYSSTSSQTSIFNLNKLLTTAKQTFNTIKLFLYSGGIISFILLYYIILRKIKFAKKTKILLLLWFLPSFLFYCLIHLGKVGYIMTIAPIIPIVGIWIIYTTKSLTKKYIIIFIIIIIQLIFFLFDLEPKNTKLNHLLINVSPYKINTQTIKYNDSRLREIITSLEKYDPKDTIILSEGDSPYIMQRTNFIKDIRHLNYYLPQHYIYYLFNDKSITRYYMYKGIDRRLLYQSYIPIEKTVKNIILVTDGYNYDIYNFEYLDIHLTENIYYKNISDMDEFEYLGYRFVKQK
ncbi:MAG: DUF2723 domain-containing protein [Patescibacteria group bacterium]|nr:DUF2723 domain-containing protein [Patescibacteria group bacterium]MDD4304576.1 DUF2723 domain-containing protein [Patescibacteria group bacterium]MDD4695611.1 DUF2723 domain-containing protein [Patescibacteria group bacterium]